MIRPCRGIPSCVQMPDERPVSGSGLIVWLVLALTVCWPRVLSAQVKVKIVGGAGVGGREGGVRVNVGNGPHGPMSVAQFRGTIVVFQEAAVVREDGEDADLLEDLFVKAPPGVAPQVQMTRGTPDDFVFGQGATARSVSSRFEAQLLMKIDAIDRQCTLTSVQKLKLQLAGRGDIKRLVDRAEHLKARFENCGPIADVAQFQSWIAPLAADAEKLAPALCTGPFGDDSLFGKILKRILTAEQAEKLGRPQTATPLPGNRIGRHDTLETVLADWERASARVARLDCTFLRFRYDPAFEVESRGTGSLQVDSRNRAVYTVGPAPMPPEAAAQKRGADGKGFTLQADDSAGWRVAQ